MNTQQMQQLKQQLLEEKARIERHLRRNDNFGLESSMNDSIGELSGYDNHPADIASELFERGKDLALNDAEERHLAEVNGALHRMETGEYGKCRACHQEIPFERLEAVPYTEYCIQHHPEPNVSQKRPIEEQVVHPAGHNMDNEDYTGYDGEDAWQEVERYGTSNPPDFFPDAHHYNELVIDGDEPRGYVDLVEGFSITDLDGHTDEISQITHNEAYRKKEREEELIEAEVESRVTEWDLRDRSWK